VVLAIVGLLVLDGAAGGVALAAAAVALLVGVIRALMGADLCGVVHGPPS